MQRCNTVHELFFEARACIKVIVSIYLPVDFDAYEKKKTIANDVRTRLPKPAALVGNVFSFKKEIFCFPYRHDCDFFFFLSCNDTMTVKTRGISFERSTPIPISGVARFRARREINYRTIDRFLRRRDSRGCEPDTQCCTSNRVACKHVVSAGSCCPTTDTASLWTGFCAARRNHRV